jgi:IS5 family transposase
MVGLHLLKHARGVWDEQVCTQWIENAYFQYFCGETYFQTRLPLDRTSMSVWRGRIGPDKLEALLAETLAAAARVKAVTPSQMQRVTVDTTAQTKAVAHPTDSHLLLRAIEWQNSGRSPKA